MVIDQSGYRGRELERYLPFDVDIVTDMLIRGLVIMMIIFLGIQGDTAWHLHLYLVMATLVLVPHTRMYRLVSERHHSRKYLLAVTTHCRNFCLFSLLLMNLSYTHNDVRELPEDQLYLLPVQVHGFDIRRKACISLLTCLSNPHATNLTSVLGDV